MYLIIIYNKNNNKEPIQNYYYNTVNDLEEAWQSLKQTYKGAIEKYKLLEKFIPERETKQKKSGTKYVPNLTTGEYKIMFDEFITNMTNQTITTQTTTQQLFYPDNWMDHNEPN